MVADNTSHLWDGTLDNPINVSETSTAGIVMRVATGTTSNGSISNDAWLGLHLSSVVTTGRSDSTTVDWTDEQIGGLADWRLYGYSEVLTVPSDTPVPEPASLTLLGLGLAGMGARRWRQRKTS